MHFAPRVHFAALAAFTLVLTGCASLAPAPRDEAFVVLGENGAAIARVISSAAACPAIAIDGVTHPMSVRAAPGTDALRATVSPPANSKPSAFPVLTCEAVIPAGAQQAAVGAQVLALPKATPRRIVVIGDTGCRLKDNGDYQDCNRPAAFPFAAIARQAADWHPDLVVHVGDYHYRENACPADRPGCKDSPWGYGWDAWQADFFGPATPLLRAAPWVLARGNHESCARAGQGWWRFLDPRPLVAGRDCKRKEDDGNGDFSDPYAVPLGGGAQLIVLDTSATTYKGLAPADPRMAKFADMYRKMAALSAQAPHTIVVDHHPILAFGALRDKAGLVTLFDGDKGLQDAFGAVDPRLLPSNVQVLLSGHVHLWEQVSFRNAYPTQFVSGFSGTAEDIVPLPEELPEGAQPAPGAIVDALSSWVDGFGYMTMERTAVDGWDVKVWDLDGQIRNRCTVSGSKSKCEKKQVH
jgi:hypothetical protein